MFVPVGKYCMVRCVELCWKIIIIENFEFSLTILHIVALHTYDFTVQFFTNEIQTFDEIKRPLDENLSEYHCEKYFSNFILSAPAIFSG